jgi:hypothetical protein
MIDFFVGLVLPVVTHLVAFAAGYWYAKNQCWVDPIKPRE